jgi:hypothetical protein
MLLINQTTHLFIRLARTGDLDLVKLLLEKGANPNAISKLNNTPLHKAVKYGHTEVARHLLCSGADATLAGNDLYKLLLENGANPNAVNESKATPLHDAAGNGHTEAARHLLGSGADATLTNNQMFTPLQFAVDKGRKDVVLLLLSYQQDM